MSKSLWEGKTLSNSQLFRTERVLILALTINHLRIIFHELPRDEAKGQKCALKFPAEKMEKKEREREKKPPNNGNIVCIFNNSWLCQPRSENYKYSVIFTSYISFIVDFEKHEAAWPTFYPCDWQCGFVQVQLQGNEIFLSCFCFCFNLQTLFPWTISLDRKGKRLMPNLTVSALDYISLSKATF